MHTTRTLIRTRDRRQTVDDKPHTRAGDHTKHTISCTYHDLGEDDAECVGAHHGAHQLLNVAAQGYETPGVSQGEGGGAGGTCASRRQATATTITIRFTNGSNSRRASSQGTHRI